MISRKKYACFHSFVYVVHMMYNHQMQFEMKQILAVSSQASPNVVDKESKTQRRVLLKVTQVSNDSYA